MSSRLYALLVVALLATIPSGLVIAQNPKPDEKPAEKPAVVKDKTRDYSQEALVVELLKTHYRFEKDGTGMREVDLRVRVQSDAGVQGFGQLVFAYSAANEKLDIENVSVKKSDGSIVKASASDIQDLTAPISRDAPIYTDLRQKHVTVPGLRPGDTLQYHVIWTVHTPFAANHFWLEHDFIKKNLIVLDEQLTVDVPSDSPVKLKNGQDGDPVVKEGNGRKFYSWKHTNLERADLEDEENKTTKKKNPEDEEPKPPSVQMTTFQTWAEVGEWYSTLQKDRITPDDKIRAKAEELVKSAKSDDEKIKALYEYVAKNFRYVSLSLGQGRYQPHSAAEVFANQYGDCKDKHTLLSSMLAAAGLHGYPALINSMRKIDADVPSPGQFDHVISVIPVGEQSFWVDTTAEIAPFRLLSPLLRDKKALVIPQSGPAKLETTPAEPPFLTTEIVSIEGQVNDLGKLSAHSHMTLRGDNEAMFRLVFRKTPRSEWKRSAYYFSTFFGGQYYDVSEIKPSDPEALDMPFEIEYDFSADGYVDWSSKKSKVALPLPAVSLFRITPDKQESSKPIQLGPPADVTYRAKISLPAKYQARLPLPLKVTRDYAEYSSTYKLEGNVFTAERRFQLKQREIPAARTQDYIAFVAAVNSDEVQTLSLETTESGTPSLPDTVKVEELIEAAEAASKNDNYPVVEDLLKRVLQKEPTHKDVRQRLAWALFAQQKHDETISVLKEQTKMNPFDGYSFNLLGRVYWQQQNYAEGEKAFRKQLEIAPLDQTAHSNLGQMLVEWRKYKEAIPELEQAISLDPEDETLYVSLGRAYVGIGETKKATDAFDEAVKLDPGPSVWNDVAYNMALGKLQLDRAQQYAESAVTATAAELRNLELNRMTLDDLGRVSAIVAYWDTLGWVHYQKGDADTAQKYLNAAWSIGQHSEVGAHIAELLEKRGTRDDAVHMYALAGVANRLVPEANEGLVRLAGKEKSAELLKNALDELRNARTIKLGSLLKGEKNMTEAQFYVVLSPGPSRSAQVADVKFIRGDEKLRTVGATALKNANYNFNFPDDTITKVIRRGTLFCQPQGECSFLMMAPDVITSVD